ncbi:MAG: nucleoside hydrolase, partial [Bacteroidetes bacterium]|nr:nucleoside hydrolase [Bacteroidota bacterium]
KATHYYISYHRSTEKMDGCFLHDPIAMAAAIRPEWFRFVDSFVKVETRGDLTSGMTIADFRKKTKSRNSQIGVAFDAMKFLRDLTDKVFGTRLNSDLVRSGCLRQRFIPDFTNRLR